MTHALHLTTWHPYIDGSAGTFVLDQCAAVSSVGVTVGLVFSRIEGLRSFSARRLLRGLPGFVALSDPVPSFGFTSWNVPWLRRLLPDVNKRMLVGRYLAYQRAYGKPDILHAHVVLETGIATRKIAEQTGLEFVVTEHSSEILNGIESLQRRALATDLYTAAKCVIAVSEPLADRISDLAPQANIKVIPNLVRNHVFKLKRNQKEDGDRIKIVSISSLVPAKRIAHAVQAIAALPDGLRSRIVYHIVGDGPERRAIAAQAAAVGFETHFHRILPHHLAMEILAAADILIHPSSFETFGIVLAEAMALGIPVLATRCGGPDTIVTDESGLLVPVDDIDALSVALAQMLEDLDFWTDRRDSAIASAQARFSEQQIGSRILETYQ